MKCKIYEPAKVHLISQELNEELKIEQINDYKIKKANELNINHRTISLWRPLNEDLPIREKVLAFFQIPNSVLIIPANILNIPDNIRITVNYHVKIISSISVLIICAIFLITNDPRALGIIAAFFMYVLSQWISQRN